MAPDYPHNSPYAFSENRVLDGVELEGLEYSVTEDKKGIHIIQTIKVVNDSDLSKDQLEVLVKKRIELGKKIINGKNSKGINVSYDVVINKNATLVWEYNNAIIEYDGGIGSPLGMGYTSGNTQVGKTQVNVPANFKDNDDGFPNYNDAGIATASQTGVHEDGHQGGLPHVESIKNKQLRQKSTRSGKNFMKKYSETNNEEMLPEQRDIMIETIRKEQKDENN